MSWVTGIVTSPLNLWIFNFKLDILKSSPYLYLVSGIPCNSIPVIVSFTFTSNVFVFPSYVTFIVCIPDWLGLNVLNVTLSSVNGTAATAAPLAITFCTLPPVRSKLSPYWYSVLSGFTKIISFT